MAGGWFGGVPLSGPDREERESMGEAIRYSYETAGGRQRHYVEMTPMQQVFFGMAVEWERGPKTAKRRAQLHEVLDRTLDYFDAFGSPQPSAEDRRGLTGEQKL